MPTTIELETQKTVKSGFTVGLTKDLPVRKKVKGEWKNTGEVNDKFRVGFIQNNGFFRGLSLNPEQITPEIAKACVKEFNKYVK